MYMFRFIRYSCVSVYLNPVDCFIRVGLIVIPGLEDMAVQKGKKWTRLRGKPLRLNLLGALVLSMVRFVFQS